MNIWDFVNKHPVLSTVVGVVGIGGLTATGIAYACNKTPVIGSFSPTLNIGFGNGTRERDQRRLEESRESRQKPALPYAGEQASALTAGSQSTSTDK